MKRRNSYSLKRKTPYARKAAMPKQLALNSAMKPEMKYFDVISTATGTANLTPLILVSLGSLSNERIGNSIRVARISIRGYLRHDSNTPITGPGFARILVVQDRQANGALATQADVLAVNGTAGTTEPILLPYNVFNKQRFKILSDRSFDANFQQPTVADTLAGQQFSTDLKNLNIPVVFSDVVPGTPTTISAVRSNNISVLQVFQDTPNYAINWISRIYYYDT